MRSASRTLHSPQLRCGRHILQHMRHRQRVGRRQVCADPRHVQCCLWMPRPAVVQQCTHSHTPRCRYVRPALDTGVSRCPSHGSVLLSDTHDHAAYMWTVACDGNLFGLAVCACNVQHLVVVSNKHIHDPQCCKLHQHNVVILCGHHCNPSLCAHPTQSVCQRSV